MKHKPGIKEKVKRMEKDQEKWNDSNRNDTRSADQAQDFHVPQVPNQSAVTKTGLRLKLKKKEPFSNSNHANKVQYNSSKNTTRKQHGIVNNKPSGKQNQSCHSSPESALREESYNDSISSTGERHNNTNNLITNNMLGSPNEENNKNSYGIYGNNETDNSRSALDFFFLNDTNNNVQTGQKTEEETNFYTGNDNHAHKRESTMQYQQPHHTEKGENNIDGDMTRRREETSSEIHGCVEKRGKNIDTKEANTSDQVKSCLNQKQRSQEKANSKSNKTIKEKKRTSLGAPAKRNFQSKIQKPSITKTKDKIIFRNRRGDDHANSQKSTTKKQSQNTNSSIKPRISPSAAVKNKVHRQIRKSDGLSRLKKEHSEALSILGELIAQDNKKVTVTDNSDDQKGSANVNERKDSDTADNLSRADNQTLPQTSDQGELEGDSNVPEETKRNIIPTNDLASLDIKSMTSPTQVTDTERTSFPQTTCGKSSGVWTESSSTYGSKICKYSCEKYPQNTPTSLEKKIKDNIERHEKEEFDGDSIVMIPVKSDTSSSSPQSLSESSGTKVKESKSNPINISSLNLLDEEECDDKSSTSNKMYNKEDTISPISAPSYSSSFSSKNSIDSKDSCGNKSDAESIDRNNSSDCYSVDEDFVIESPTEEKQEEGR